MSLMRSSTIDGVVRRSARAFGDRVALVFGEREWTYRELEDATSRAAAALLAQGLTKGDRVAAFGRNSDAYLLGFLACARAGLVHVPLNYNLTGYELEYLVTQSGSSLVAEYLSCVVALDLAQDDEPLHVMPLYHSAQMHVFLLPWLAVGARSTLLEVPDPGEILARIERDGHRAFFAAPTLWVAMTNHADFAGRDLSSLRKAYYGASIMPGPVVERLQAKMPELGLYNCFGQSEMGPLCTVLRPEEHAERPDSAGRPVLLTEMRVVDGEGRDVAPGEMGEVVYRSPQLCLGYWDKPQETAEAFVDGWFHSGDLVRVDEQGYITVVDRIKDVINSGGVLIASREVEDALFSHPAVAEAAVIGTPDERWVEAVTAVVVLQDEVSTADLLEHARTRLAGFKVPKSVHVVDALPKNTSGKILKRQLRDELA